MKCKQDWIERWVTSLFGQHERHVWQALQAHRAGVSYSIGHYQVDELIDSLRRAERAEKERIRKIYLDDVEKHKKFLRDQSRSRAERAARKTRNKCK